MTLMALVESGRWHVYIAPINKLYLFIPVFNVGYNHTRCALTPIEKSGFQNPTWYLPLSFDDNPCDWCDQKKPRINVLNTNGYRIDVLHTGLQMIPLKSYMLS